MKLKDIFTPQVRTFVYGATAALLSVATARSWITDDLAASINENLPTIIGAIASILAAANVKPVAKVETPAPVEAAPTPNVPTIIGLPQGAAVEEPLT